MRDTTPALLEASEGFELSPEQLAASRCGVAVDARAELRLGVDASLPSSRLRAALDQVVARHEILRTRLCRLPGVAQPVQVVDAAAAAADAGMVLTLAASETETRDAALQLPVCSLDVSSLRLLALDWARACLGELDPTAPLQYADYAAWRNERVAEGGSGQIFWARTLAEYQPLTRLPFREHAPVARSCVPRAVHDIALSESFSQRVQQRAATLGCEVELVSLLAWLRLLHAHAGDAAIGLALDWQARPAHVAGALGSFFGPLPLSSRLDAADSSRAQLASLLARIDALLEWRDAYVDPGPVALSPCGFRFVPWSAQERATLRRAGLRLEGVQLPVQGSSLELECVAGDGRWELRLGYDPQRYGPHTLALLEQQLLHGIAQLCDQPDRSAVELPTCSEDELRVVAELGDPAALERTAAARYVGVQSAGHLAACLLPAAGWVEPALHGLDVALSHAELRAQTERLSRVLRARGVTRGQAVAHFLPRSPDAVVGMLAILQAGASYVPIDPAAPPQRVAAMLKTAGVELVVTRRDVCAALPEPFHSAERQVQVDAAPEREPLRWEAPRADDVAYVIFTSGSTGQPKAVPITHAAALHSLGARLAYYSQPIGRFLLVSSFAFDSSLAGLFATLAQGGSLYVCDEAQARDPALLAGLIRSHGITHLLALPSLYQAILDELPADGCTLQCVIVAGEACTPAVIERHRRVLPQARLYNEYGPTEAAVWSTVADCTAHDCALPVTIGRPIPHGRVLVLDQRQRFVPRGVCGELYVGGAGLSPGYVQQPELSAQRFVTVYGQRLYRTGDLGYWNEQGELVFIGRSDQQVKVRGHRVELAEIEAALVLVSQAQSAVVVADRAPNGETRLRAFLEAAEAHDPGELRTALRAHLPEAMWPAEIETLPELPRTTSGKIDRPALLARTPTVRRASYARPRGHVEKALAQHFQALLGVDHVGRDDDFFALGGHSLLVVRLLHRLRTHMGAELRVSSVFEHPKLAQLAAALEAGADGDGLCSLKPGGRDTPALFCLHESYGDVHHYFPLVPQLPEGQRMIGIPLDAGIRPEDTSIAQLAREYWQHIRAAQPAGPYALCGYSLGGVLALAIAELIEASGERVAFLGLLDATLQVGLTSLAWPELQTALRAELTPDAAERFDVLAAEALATLRAQTEGRGVVAQLEHALYTWAREHTLSVAAPPEALAATLGAMHNARTWLTGYAPPRIEAALDLFVAEQTLARDPGMPGAWQACTRGSLRVSVIPGDHNELLRQPMLHDALRAALARTSA